MPKRMFLRRLATTCVALVCIAAGCNNTLESDAPGPSTVDREFDLGSRLEDRELSSAQVANVALLAKVWGFAKYHHPAVVNGTVNWDYALFRALPSVLAAPDRERASAAIVTWLDALGSVPACNVCATMPSGVQLPADNAWIEDAANLGPTLSDRLRSIYRNRLPAPTQRYVAFVPGVENPDFSAEQRYANLSSPDAGYRLLALFRFWNIIKYWFPYRDVMNEDWDGVLAEFIPVMMRPLTGDHYRLALIRLIGRVHDTHANLWSDLRVQPPLGTSEAPLTLRFVENKLVVTDYSHATLGPATGIGIGDEIQRIDEFSIATLVDSLRPYFPASNEPTRLRDIARVDPRVRTGRARGCRCGRRLHQVREPGGYCVTQQVSRRGA